MTGTEPERRPELRISDADRDRAVARLNDAVAEGRLSMSEFDERVSGVLQARTASELEPHLADLPRPAGTPASREHGEIRGALSSLKRTGRWVVPRRLNVRSGMGSVKLDLTDAVISHSVIEIEIEVTAGSTTLVLPRGASVDIEQVQLVAGSASVRKVPTATDPTGEPHVVVTGKQLFGSLTVRHQRKFLRWRW